MKPVTFEVAKALKEAGYPQEKLTDKVYLVNCDKEGILAHYQSALYYDCVVAPTYLNVWLWLWKEKNICIEITDNGYYTLAKVMNQRFHGDSPEDAIVDAIKYLVDNNKIV